MGKYVVVVILVVLTGILAAIFPYAQNTKGNERPLVTVLDTLYAADLDAEEIAICYLGGHTFLVRTQNHVILFDPEDKISPLDIHGIKRLDLLLITQRSITPSEIETVRSICEKTTTVLTNRAIHGELRDYVPPEKLREIHAKEPLSLSDLTVTAISSNGETDGRLMFVISMDNLRVFHGSNFSFAEDYGPKVFSEIIENANNVDVAFVPASGSLAEDFQYQLKLISMLRPQIVVTMQGSPDEQNALKNLIEKENPSISVLIPETLWVYELLAK